MSNPAYDLTYLVANADEEIKRVRQRAVCLTNIFYLIVKNYAPDKDLHARGQVEFGLPANLNDDALADLLDNTTTLSVDKAWMIVLSGVYGLTLAKDMYSDLTKLVESTADLPIDSQRLFFRKLARLEMVYIVPAGIMEQLGAAHNNIVLTNTNIDAKVANKFGPDIIQEKINAIIRSNEISNETKLELEKISGHRYPFSAVGLVGYFKQVLGGKL
ncbi:MAG: hypothetical protein HY438_02680 [DPANN group archaeon]|nr:hypothetical protein [DPANN group archaeon]